MEMRKITAIGRSDCANLLAARHFVSCVQEYRFDMAAHWPRRRLDRPDRCPPLRYRSSHRGDDDSGLIVVRCSSSRRFRSPAEHRNVPQLGATPDRAVMELEMLERHILAASIPAKAETRA